MKIWKTLKPGDLLILILVLLAAVIVIIKSSSMKSGKVIVTTLEATYEYSLSSNGIYKVKGTLGETVFEIKDEKVRIIDSPCPNKTCVALGWSSPLICLPNNVVIHLEKNETENEKSGGFDGISQ